MTSARLRLGRAVDLRDAVDAGLVELSLQVAGGVGELGEDQHLLAGELLRLEQPDQLLQLVVVLRLELPGLVEEVHDLVEVEEGLVHHLVDVVLLAVELLDRVEHLLRDDVLVVGLVARRRPRARAGAASRSRGSRRSGVFQRSSRFFSASVSLWTSRNARSFSSRRSQDSSNAHDGALEALEEVACGSGRRPASGGSSSNGSMRLVGALVPGQRVVDRQREQRVLACETPSRTCRAAGRRSCGSSTRRPAAACARERPRPCRSRGSGSRARRRGCAGRRAAGRSRPSARISCASAMCSATSATSCPTVLRSAFSMLLKCARRLLTPSVRAK